MIRKHPDLITKAPGGVWCSTGYSSAGAQLDVWLMWAFVCLRDAHANLLPWWEGPPSDVQCEIMRPKRAFVHLSHLIRNGLVCRISILLYMPVKIIFMLKHMKFGEKKLRTTFQNSLQLLCNNSLVSSVHPMIFCHTFLYQECIFLCL